MFTSLVDTGFDLIAVSRDGRRFLPVQVKYKELRTGFALDRDDSDKLVNAGAVIAFGSRTRIADSEAADFWFVPAKAWKAQADAASETRDSIRRDNKLVVYFASDPTWPEQFKGTAGLQAAFAALIG